MRADEVRDTSRQALLALRGGVTRIHECTVSRQFADRGLTLMRTTSSECAEFGTRLAERVSAATAAATVFPPLRGVPTIAIEGGTVPRPRRW